MTLARLSFHAPHHGWLPVRIELAHAVLEFHASDVPNNPVQDLVDALHAAARDLPAKVWWHLEPDAYWFDFSPVGALVRLRIRFSENHDEPEDQLVDTVGSKAELLLPVWRALRRFQTFKLEEAHWPTVDFTGIEALRGLLRE